MYCKIVDESKKNNSRKNLGSVITKEAKEESRNIFRSRKIGSKNIS
jgi:hypothetical protein